MPNNSQYWYECQYVGCCQTYNNLWPLTTCPPVLGSSCMFVPHLKKSHQTYRFDKQARSQWLWPLTSQISSKRLANQRNFRQSVPKLSHQQHWNVRADGRPENAARRCHRQRQCAARDAGHMCFSKDGGGAQVKWSISPGDQYTPVWVNRAHIHTHTHTSLLPSREEMFSP